MTVLIYIAVFAAIVAAVCIGGAICESEAFEERAQRAGRGAASLAEKVLSVLLVPVEAAFSIYERVTGQTSGR